jgi:peptidyl-prolyl cis-trans isomerase D
MFDLFHSRAKAMRILLIVMLSMVALSMLVYLIPGAGTTSTGSSNDQVIAEIGKDVVTVPEVDLQIKNLLQGRSLPANMVSSYLPQLIDQAISDRAVAFEAQSLGIQISDQDLANIIRSFPFGAMTPDQYRQYVSDNMGVTVQEFESNVRMAAYQNALQQIAMEGVIVTPAEVEHLYHVHNDKIKLEYMAFDPVKTAREVKLTPEELKSYFDKNKGFFPTPETRNFQLVVADQVKIAETIQVSDAQVENYYNSHKDQYRTPERVHARHILLSTTGKSDADKVTIKAKAEDLLKQLRAGADFAQLAQKNSEDPGSATKGGDLGWVVRGQMVKEFEDTTFSLKPAEISNVITTQYGFHIIQVLEKEPARLRTLAEAKPEIVVALRNQTVFDKMQTLSDQAHADLVQAPQNAEQIAAKLGLIFQNFERYRAGTPIAGMGSDQQIPQAVGTLKKGEVSQVIQAGNKLVIVALTAITPPHPAEFADAEQQVRQTYSQQKAVSLVAENAKKAADLVNSLGGDMQAAAKKAGAEVKTTDFFARDGAAEGIGTAQYLGDSFDKPIGTVLGPLNVGSQTVVVKIIERQPADMTKLAAQRDAMIAQIKQGRAGERQALLQDSVLTRLVQEGKVKKHQDVINRMLARYRS